MLRRFLTASLPFALLLAAFLATAAPASANNTYFSDVLMRGYSGSGTSALMPYTTWQTPTYAPVSRPVYFNQPASANQPGVRFVTPNSIPVNRPLFRNR